MQKPVVGQNTVVDMATAAAASLSEWGPESAPQPTLARHVNRASDVALGAAAAAGKLSHALSRTGPAALAAAASSTGREAVGGEEETAPATAGPYCRLAWTVFLGVLDAALVLVLIFWPAPDALCRSTSTDDRGWNGGEDSVWAAILSGVFLHVADMVWFGTHPLTHLELQPLRLELHYALIGHHAC